VQSDYRRDTSTWLIFAGLLAFGVLNAVLGPALPYLRAAEHISYLVASLHQVAFAAGGGVAAVLTVALGARVSRRAVMLLGLALGGGAGLALGYGQSAAVTIIAAFAMSLFASSSLIRMWAILADQHGPRRAVAMTEGEVSVSLGGIVAPLLIAAVASTALGWRFAFVINTVMIGAAVLAMRAARFAQPPAGAVEQGPGPVGPRATLTIVFAIVALEFSLSFWLASYLHDTVGLARSVAVLMVSLLYFANLCGRLITSRLARRRTARRLLGASLGLTIAGTPILLAAGAAPVAGLGIVLTGAGIGGLYPLTSSLHVALSPRSADGAIGQVQGIASIGQIAGPLAVGAIAQAAGLRVGLLVVPALALLGAGALATMRGR
jgi:MFS family permease